MNTIDKIIELIKLDKEIAKNLFLFFLKQLEWSYINLDSPKFDMLKR